MRSSALLTFCCLSLITFSNEATAQGFKKKLNTAPVVNAGADVKASASKEGIYAYRLTGSAFDAENNITSYRVYRNGALISETKTPAFFSSSMALKPGSYTFNFEAIDDRGLKGSDAAVVTVSAFVVNTAPVVNAGADIMIETSEKAASVSLKGSASDAQNNIALYEIKEGATVLRSGSTASIFSSALSLSVGVHDLTFKATDSGNLSGSDVVTVTVKAKVLNTAPVVNAGPDMIVVASAKGGGVARLQGSATDAQNNIVTYSLKNGSQVIRTGADASILTSEFSAAPGTYTLTLEAVDAGQLSGSDSVMITIKAPDAPVPPTGNLSANAGPDISQNQINVDGVNQINITGSATGNIVSYVWKVNDVIVSRSSNASSLAGKFNFIRGKSTLTLEVTDASGAKATDMAWIEVKPTLAAGEKIALAMNGARIVIDKDFSGSEAVQMLGTVVSVNPIKNYRWKYKTMVFDSADPASLTRKLDLPVGQYIVYLEVEDTLGNKAITQGGISVSANYIDNVPKVAPNYNIDDFLVPSWGHAPGYWNDESAFRFHCKASHLLYDDPIVFPGQKGKSHLHMFFGNNTANGDSTYVTLRSNGTSSCHGGPLNRSAYWMPAVINENGKAVLPDMIAIYYKDQPGAVRLPRGLKAVFGKDLVNPANSGHAVWKCDSQAGKFDTIPEIKGCPATGNGTNYIMTEIAMPSCWNGQLDSPDHRSHLANGSYASGWGTYDCPATHPILIPHFTMIAAFSHSGEAEYSKWRLSSDVKQNPDGSLTQLPAGSTLHADWFGAWDDSIADQWQDGCINGFFSCSGGDLGTDKQLKMNPGFNFDAPVPRLVDPPVKPM